MHPVLIYITCKDKLQAETIATALIESRLIACANILPGATSLYRWEGKLERVEECIIIAKSMAPRAEAIVKKVKELHAYEVPCVAVLPLIDGNDAFMQWVAKETS